TWMNPGASGSLTVLRPLRPEADSDPIVEPCHDRYRLMTLYLPGLPLRRWYWRASLIAASVTSEPPHWNLTADRSPGVSSASRFANCTATGLVPCMGGEKCSVSSCVRIASMTRRLLCPTEAT